MTDNQTPQNRISLTGLPQGGQPSEIQMDGKKLMLENLGSEGYLCRITEGQEAEKRVSLTEGTTTVWHDEDHNRIDVVVDNQGGLTILGFKPSSVGSKTFASVHTESGEGASATAFAASGKKHFKSGKGFPFKHKK